MTAASHGASAGATAAVAGDREAEGEGSGRVKRIATCQPPNQMEGGWHWLRTDAGKPHPLEWDESHQAYILNCAHEDPAVLWVDGWRYLGPAIPPEVTL